MDRLTGSIASGAATSRTESAATVSYDSRMAARYPVSAMPLTLAASTDSGRDYPAALRCCHPRR
jgi:hypothetical protein